MLAAGVLLQAPDGQVLFLKRGPDGDEPGTWCLPAGRIEEGETPEDGARRECEEETGYRPEELFELNATDTFTTFLSMVDVKFVAVDRTNEHEGFCWASVDQAPEPLHPGLKAMLTPNEDKFEYAPGDLELYDPEGNRVEVPDEEEVDEVPEGAETFELVEEP